jgi:hypothetical protein
MTKEGREIPRVANAMLAPSEKDPGERPARMPMARPSAVAIVRASSPRERLTGRAGRRRSATLRPSALIEGPR